MIGRKILEAVVPLLTVDEAGAQIADMAIQVQVTDNAAAEAERLILEFAAQDIADLRQRNMHLIGLRLQDVLCNPDASAAHINAAMKWLDHTDPAKVKAEDINPMQAAIANAREALAAGGKLPPIETEDV